MKKWLKRLVYRLRGEYTVERLVEMGLTVGKNFNPQLGVTLDPSHCWLITIGDDVTMAPHVQILAHDAGPCVHLGYAKIGRVDIGSRVFIGANTIILPGVTIGDDVIIGAGAVVTCNVPSGMVYAGNPAQAVCTLEAYLSKHKSQMQQRPVWDDSYTLRKNVTEANKNEQKEALTDGIGYVQ